MEHVNIATAITIVIATFSPLLLQFAPLAWKGKTMALIAMGISVALGLVNLAATGQLDHFNAATAALTLVAFIGAQQGFYAAFKDAWHLADPPTPAPVAVKP